MQAKIIGILINPFKRSITLCDIPATFDGEGFTCYEGLRDLIFQDRPERGYKRGYIEHVSVGADHGIYIDEEEAKEPKAINGEAYLIPKHGASSADEYVAKRKQLNHYK